MPDKTPELLKATQILALDEAVTPTGGRILTRGISSTSTIPLEGFTPSSTVGRGSGGEGGIPLGKTNSPTSGDEVDTTGWDDQAFLARVVAEAIDADNPNAGKGLPEMAEVGDGILIYMLNRYAGYEEFLAEPLLHTSMAPRYKLDLTYPTPITPGEIDEETGEQAAGISLPSLTDEKIQKNRKSTYLYQFIECVFDDIKNNPHVFELGVTGTGEVAEDVVTEKDFLSCADIQPVCLACMQSVLDIRGWDQGEADKNKADPVEGYKSKQGIKGDQSPCDGKAKDLTKDEIEAYFTLLIQAPGEAIQKVIESMGGTENTSDLPQPCVPPPDPESAGCSPLQPYLANHLNPDVADKLASDGPGFLERYFQECLCPALKLGYFIMPLPPLAIGGTFHVTLPLATEAWFASLSDEDIPGFTEHKPAMGGGGVEPPMVPASQPKPASAAPGFDPNTKENLKEAYKELATALGKDLDRDVVPALEDGSIKLLSLSVPSPIIPWAEITELEVMTVGGATELGAHFAHAVLEWAVDQIHMVDLRILGLPVAVGPPPYVGLMGSIPPPEPPDPIPPVKTEAGLGVGV